MREVHFDERDDAEAFRDELAEAGIAATLHRDEFAGEDDYEDAAWVVAVADHPGLAARVERAGGWLAPDEQPVRAAPLPTAPRRLKREPASPPPEG